MNAGKIHADTHLDPPFGCQISDSWRIQAHTLSDIMRPPYFPASPRLNINSSVLRRDLALATEVSFLRQRAASHDNLRFPMAPGKAAFFFFCFGMFQMVEHQTPQQNSKKNINKFGGKRRRLKFVAEEVYD